MLVVGVTILAGGALVGYASGRNKASPATASDSQQQQQLNGVQLPFPDSAAARQLLADPATPGAATTACKCKMLLPCPAVAAGAHGTHIIEGREPS
jgi:hypothetical protein